MDDLSNQAVEKPQNGVAGLKHLYHDIFAGIVVSLVSLPLSSGIAIASGLPPIYGLISAIIAGLVFPFVGGAYLTIAGPAAGLAPAIMVVMVSLGGAGDAEHVGKGYHFLLVVVFFVGCAQLILSLLKLAKFAAIIPVTVVEGMLAAIGLLIIVKQLPMFFGYTGAAHPHEFFDFVLTAPEFARGMTAPVFLVGGVSLVLLFLLGAISSRVRILKIIPPQLLVVVIGVALGHLAGLNHLEGSFLIKLPANPFSGLHTPDFAGLLMRSDLWYAATLGVVLLTMIDGVESLATAMAVDRIDPYHRKSDPNRVLMAMAISNIVSSLVGGLTIIPGGVKSKVNVAAGGRTLWANFTNAVCLIVYLMVAAAWINMIPKCVLAAVLIFTGWKMCEPKLWKHVAHIGKEQLVIFAFTVLVTLITDLLIGICAGVAVSYFLDVLLCRDALQHSKTNQSVWWQATAIFKNPVTRREMSEGTYHLYLNRPLASFNVMQLSEELEDAPHDAKCIHLHLESGVLLVDHTATENLMHVQQELRYADVILKIEGIEKMEHVSHAPNSMYVWKPSDAAQAV